MVTMIPVTGADGERWYSSHSLEKALSAHGYVVLPKDRVARLAVKQTIPAWDFVAVYDQDMVRHSIEERVRNLLTLEIAKVVPVQEELVEHIWDRPVHEFRAEVSLILPEGAKCPPGS